MANEFIIKNGAISKGSLIVSGALYVTGSFTSSLQTGYILVGDGNNLAYAFPTASLSGGTSGGSGSSGTSGSTGSSGTAGSSGTSGSTGSTGTSGSSGTSGSTGSTGTSGSSGTSGSTGSTGTSGSSGTSGSTGSTGTSGSSGTSGSTGSTGTSGSSGTRGSSGTAGSSGTSGTGFTTITTPGDNRILTSNGSNAAIAQPNLIFNPTYATGVSQLMISNSLVVSGSQNNVGVPLFEVRELLETDGAYFIISSGSIDHLKITKDGIIIATASLFVSKSITDGTNFTASLQTGYVWVGGANNISTIITTSSFFTLNSNLDNYIVTATGTANTLQGESKFTYDGKTAIITGSLVVSGSNGGGVFSKGITVADIVNGISVSGSYIGWRAPFSCSVIGIYGYREGGGASQINAARTSSAGLATHRSTNLSLTTPGVWTSGGTVQNTIYNPGDGLYLIVSGSGSTQIGVQVDFLKLYDPNSQ